MKKQNRTLLQKLFRRLESNFMKGHDDFHNCECIDFHTYDKIKERFLKLEKDESCNILSG